MFVRAGLLPWCCWLSGVAYVTGACSPRPVVEVLSLRSLPAVPCPAYRPSRAPLRAGSSYRSPPPRMLRNCDRLIGASRRALGF